MSLTFANLQTLTSDWLDDKQNGYFDLPTLKLRINLALLELQKRLISANQSYYAKCVETSTVAGQQPYAIPSDFLQILKLELVLSGSGVTATTKPLQKITVQMTDTFTYQSGEPDSYFFEGNNIMLWPVPNAVKTLRLRYSYVVSSMVNDSDVPDAPQIFHEYITVLASRDGVLKDRPEAMQMFQAKIEFYETLLKQVAQQRFSDGPNMVSLTAGGYGTM